VFLHPCLHLAPAASIFFSVQTPLITHTMPALRRSTDRWQQDACGHCCFWYVLPAGAVLAVLHGAPGSDCWSVMHSTLKRAVQDAPESAPVVYAHRPHLSSACKVRTLQALPGLVWGTHVFPLQHTQLQACCMLAVLAPQCSSKSLFTCPCGWRHNNPCARQSTQMPLALPALELEWMYLAPCMYCAGSAPLQHPGKRRAAGTAWLWC
jgi:hypothetical protein